MHCGPYTKLNVYPFLLTLYLSITFLNFIQKIILSKCQLCLPKVKLIVLGIIHAKSKITELMIQAQIQVFIINFETNRYSFTTWMKNLQLASQRVSSCLLQCTSSSVSISKHSCTTHTLFWNKITYNLVVLYIKILNTPLREFRSFDQASHSFCALFDINFTHCSLLTVTFEFSRNSSSKTSASAEAAQLSWENQQFLSV